ncbi:MAG: PIN domain-containing protein [Bacteroidales bacterium]|nr:PIN domain-containing protein [Bacteroidales bacterium]
MMRYLLDTSSCVFFLRGKLDFNHFVDEPWRDCCCISEITVLELRYGAENSNNPKKHHDAVDVFLSGLKVIPVAAVVDTYAKEKVRLRKMGMPVHDEFDLIIGASAIANDLILVTNNVKHFKNIESIQLANWFL